MSDLPPEIEADLTEKEKEFLDMVAPREESQPPVIDRSARADEHELVQGCASCSYDPDLCGCGKYRDLMEQEDMWQRPAE